MKLWEALMLAIRTGVSTFREEYTIPTDDKPWTDVNARMARYAVYEAMYNNTVYRDIERWARQYKVAYSLYSHTRGIYNPAYRLVEQITAKTMGGTIDWERLETGAMPVEGADDQLVEALLQIGRWSKWGQNKTLFGRMTSLYGECGLWQVDDPVRRRVRIEVLSPSKIKRARFDAAGNIVETTIEYERIVPDPKQKDKDETAIYRMEVDKETFRTFRDDKPYAWNGVAEAWDNIYGFVPLVKSDYKDIGLGWSANAFHSGIGKINEINDSASILNDNIRKSNTPIWFMPGVEGPRELQITNDDSDQVPMLYGPADAKAQPMVLPVDIAQGVGNIDSMLMELERDFPQLALHRLRDAGGMSGVAIRNAYGDAVGLLEEAMANMDDAIVRAFQMSVTIGGIRGYDGFSGYDKDSYERGDLDFYIRPRPIFDDALTNMERIQVIASLPPNPAAARHILVNELGLSEEDAEPIVQGIDNEPTALPSQLPDGLTVGNDIARDVNDILSMIDMPLEEDEAVMA